jgi:hypothetical protein
VTDVTEGLGDTPEELPPLTPEESAFVSDTLAALPDEPMPEEVWQRLSAALAAEAPASTTVLPQLPQQRSGGQRDSSRRWLPVAAGVAVLAVGGLFGAQLLNDGADPSVVADGSASTEAAAAVPVVQSGTLYTSAGFEQQVTATLLPVVDDVAAPTVSPAQSAAPAAAGTPSPDLRFSPTPEWLAAMDLPGCLEAVDPAADPLLVDAASYDAEAALVITYSAGTGRLDVYAVSSSCSPADVDLLRYLSVTAD